RRKLRRLAAHQVDGFVAIEPDAVPRAVRGSGKLVAGAVAQAFIIGADRVIDRPGWNADLRGLESDELALAHLLPNLALARCRGPVDPASRHIGLIAVDVAAAVHQHHLALPHPLRLAASVRIGARLAEQNEREFG